MLKFTPNSSFISEVTFLEGVMSIHFKSGKSESFHSCPQKLYEEFEQAESAGKFYNEFVKGGGWLAPDQWTLFGSAIEDIPAGSRVEKDLRTGRVRVAKLKPLPNV